MDIPLDLTCWYLNSRRVMELVGADYLVPRLQIAERLRGQMQVNAELDIQKRAVVEWLKANNPPPLGKVLAEGEMKEGLVFTHYTNFFFKGLPQIAVSLSQGKSVPMATAYAKLDAWEQGSRLSFSFSHKHLTSDSAWNELSGQKRLLLLGVITKTEGASIEATPYVIAHPLSQSTAWDAYGQYWHDHLEVHIDSIDTFSQVSEIAWRPSKSDLKLLRPVPENDVKKAFANIIGEPTVPKDWAGELSDLYSSRVRINGNRISTAFIFKGPAQFKPMTLAELGKNGDQIDRLFKEPADLFILQHCHEVTPAVRGTMRAYAEQTGRLRLFCIIDGYDTIRILKAYKQCGLRP